MAKLWKKQNSTMHPAVEKYTAATDPIFDIEFLPFDVEAARAHAKGLERVGILSKDELESLSAGLDKLLKDFEAGKITITPADEDCYTVIENYLVEHVGEAGKKINTSKSRKETEDGQKQKRGRHNGAPLHEGESRGTTHGMYQACGAIRGLRREIQRCADGRIFTYAAGDAHERWPLHSSFCRKSSG